MIILMFISFWKEPKVLAWKALEDLENEIKPYEQEGDCALYADAPTAWVDILPGQFVIVYPEDPHAPIVGKGKIRTVDCKSKSLTL